MNSRLTSFCAVGGCALLLAGAALAGESGAASKCTFGDAERDKIVDGMSYQEVVKILGCEGEKSEPDSVAFNWKSTVPRHPDDEILTYPGISAGVRDNGKLFMVMRY
ncbi:hypothetical protein [Pseudomonas sp. CGJS7]|uniref:hypothetical protein n=1 Tax=Pseudomonas sp. CGJS7 TaxID=3109348 RepID=UPI00300B9F27